MTVPEPLTAEDIHRLALIHERAEPWGYSDRLRILAALRLAYKRPRPVCAEPCAVCRVEGRQQPGDYVCKKCGHWASNGIHDDDHPPVGESGEPKECPHCLPGTVNPYCPEHGESGEPKGKGLRSRGITAFPTGPGQAGIDRETRRPVAPEDGVGESGEPNR